MPNSGGENVPLFQKFPPAYPSEEIFPPHIPQWWEEKFPPAERSSAGHIFHPRPNSNILLFLNFKFLCAYGDFFYTLDSTAHFLSALCKLEFYGVHSPI
jgi:hypothetical protein